MRRLAFSAAARADLRETADYLTRQALDRRVGTAWNQEMRAHCRKLANLPGTLGRDRSDLRPRLRSFATGNYVVFFRYAPGVFRVIRIIEGHRDMPAQFEGE